MTRICSDGSMSLLILEYGTPLKARKGCIEKKRMSSKITRLKCTLGKEATFFAALYRDMEDVDKDAFRSLFDEELRARPDQIQMQRELGDLLFRSTSKVTKTVKTAVELWQKQSKTTSTTSFACNQAESDFLLVIRFPAFQAPQGIS